MSGQAGADVVGSGDRSSGAAIAAAFGALLALTTAELLVPGLAAGRQLRITLLAGLLMAKIGLVLVAFLRVRANRRAAGLLAVAFVMATGFAIVLMLEIWYRGGIR
jgi:cytochrome c oxidase subunit IV